MHDNPTQTELDAAVQKRLARLAAVPVDVTNLERRLRARLAVPADPTHRWRLPHTWRALTAVAAAILLVATVGVALLNFGNTPALAAPADLARLHDQVVHTDPMATNVTTIAQANRVLSGQWRDMPALPAASAAQLHACCIHDFMDRKVACLLFRDGDVPLTMVVGRARDFRCAQGRVVVQDGRRFTLHQVNGLAMVMTEQNGRYVCLMGEVTQERLLTIARGLEF